MERSYVAFLLWELKSLNDEIRKQLDSSSLSVFLDTQSIQLPLNNF